MGTDPGLKTEQVKVSVLILLDRQESGKLRLQLEGLGRQTLLVPSFEVILIDTARDRRLNPQLWEDLPLSCRVLLLPDASPAEALNHAVREARGEICLFLAAGVFPNTGLVAAHLQAHTREKGILGIGKTVHATSSGAGWHAQQYAKWMNHRNFDIGQDRRNHDWRDCWLENLSIPRFAILSADGFDPDLAVGAGPDLAYRLIQQGIHCVSNPEAAATRQEDRGYRQLSSQMEIWGTDSVRLWRKHPSMLPGLLGGFYQTSPRGVLLRRILIELKLPFSLYALVSLLLDDERVTAKWFEFLANLWFWSGVRRAIPDRQTWNRLTQGVIILMYHAFGEEGEPASHYVLPQKSFARQMGWLKRLGYRVIGLEEYLCYLRNFQLPPEKSIVITMDDGYLDNDRLALPVLRQYGFPATIFLVTGEMGKTNTWDQGGPQSGRPLISWEKAREMLAGGVSFGAHTRTHSNLTEISTEQAWLEIRGSKDDLEAELGSRDLAFAYPHGISTSETQALVGQAGLIGALTSRVGVNTPAASLFNLSRVEVRGTFSLVKFLSLLWNTVDAR